MRSLAERRHHERRHKKKALKIVKSYDGVAPTKKRIGMTAATKCNCSCWMCNKPRTVFGDSFKDERAPSLSREIALIEADADTSFIEWANERVNITNQFSEDLTFVYMKKGDDHGLLEIHADGSKICECYPEGIK